MATVQMIPNTESHHDELSATNKNDFNSVQPPVRHSSMEGGAGGSRYQDNKSPSNMDRLEVDRAD